MIILNKPQFLCITLLLISTCLVQYVSFAFNFSVWAKSLLSNSHFLTPFSVISLPSYCMSAEPYRNALFRGMAPLFWLWAKGEKPLKGYRRAKSRLRSDPLPSWPELNGDDLRAEWLNAPQDLIYGAWIVCEPVLYNFSGSLPWFSRSVCRYVYIGQFHRCEHETSCWNWMHT